jgi:hypothetical protein
LKPKKKTSRFWILSLSILVMGLLVLSACTPATTSSPDQAAEEQHEVNMPQVESSGDNSDVAEEAPVDSYPAPQPVVQEEVAYPEPEVANTAPDEQPAAQESEPYPPPTEVEEVKPTPRGNELFASNPAEFQLASGEYQLVEMFAFW